MCFDRKKWMPICHNILHKSYGYIYQDGAFDFGYLLSLVSPEDKALLGEKEVIKIVDRAMLDALGDILVEHHKQQKEQQTTLN